MFFITANNYSSSTGSYFSSNLPVSKIAEYHKQMQRNTDYTPDKSSTPLLDYAFRDSDTNLDTNYYQIFDFLSKTDKTMDKQRKSLTDLINDLDNCALYDEHDQNKVLKTGNSTKNFQKANQSVYDKFDDHLKINTTIKYLVYDHTMTEFLRPILILGGTLSILWVFFYRNVILLTDHDNAISTFFSTILYSILPSIILFACITASQCLVGNDSIKCNSCRKQQMEYNKLKSEYNWSINISTTESTTG